MTAITEITAALPAMCEARADGWTADRQRAFVEAIAEGHTVTDACRVVGMTKQSAYSFKKRAAGAAFALGWSAANLLARETLADALLVRALEGQVETCTRPDGATWTRHRHDNRLATALLKRLDRTVESAPGAEAQAARLVAREFDSFLDLLSRDAGPARAGLFLAARADSEAGDLAPIAALARADRWLQAGAGVAAEVATADLDPDHRASWSAEQWARAEAAGLVTLAVAPDTPGSSQSGQLVEPEEPAPRVWWEEPAHEWRTDFPPPDEFLGQEHGELGSCYYERQCTAKERALLDADYEADRTERIARDEPERDAWFASLAKDLAEAGIIAPASSPFSRAPAQAGAKGSEGDASDDVPTSAAGAQIRSLDAATPPLRSPSPPIPPAEPRSTSPTALHSTTVAARRSAPG